MSFRLPLTGSPLRELFDVRDLLPYGEPGGLLKAPTFRQFIATGRETLANCPGVRSVHGFALRADGHLILLRVGPGNRTRRLWDFSK